jgi:iron-sulfur cluster assembly accessory protein
MSETITRDMTIKQIFSKFPAKAQKLAQELTKAGLNCVGCSASTWETVESGVLRHGMTEKDLGELLEKLNTVLAHEVDTSTITLTEEAANEFKAISKHEGKEGWALRFDEKPAGCNGFEYVLEFSEKPSEHDMVFHSHGIDIHVYKSALGRLQGCEIDFVRGLDSGFKITNPNARSSCGCGTSHGYD